MALPEDFFEEDAQGCAGAVEPALMSTTPIREVALGFAGVASGKDLPTLLEIEVGKTCIGADISAISQFGGEGEILYTPLAMLEIIGKPRTDCSSGRELSVISPFNSSAPSQPPYATPLGWREDGVPAGIY